MADLTSRLTHLLGTTLQQLMRRGRAGRAQLDLMLLRRRRREALAVLGEAVARLAAEGRFDVEDLPELDGPFRRLEEIDERIAAGEDQARSVGGEEGDGAWTDAPESDADESAGPVDVRAEETAAAEDARMAAEVDEVPATGEEDSGDDEEEDFEEPPPRVKRHETKVRRRH